MIISIIFVIKIIINVINNGIDSMLYEMALFKFNDSISINALVIPHAGQGIVNIFLNKHGILNF